MSSEPLPGSSRWLLASSYAMLVAGFTLISPLPCLLGVGSTAVSLPFRGFVVALGVVTLVSAALRRQTLVLKFSSLLLFGLWILLVMRLFFDLGVRHVATLVPPERYFANAFGVVLLPMLVFLIRPCLRTMHLAWQLCFVSAAVAVAANLYVVFFSGCGFRWADRLSTDVLNPISFGYLGSSLGILALARPGQSRSGWKGAFVSALMGISVVVSFLLVLGTGSKGPLVSLILCVLVVALTARGLRWRLGLAAVTAGALVIGAIAIRSWTSGTEVDPIARFTEQLDRPMQDDSSVYRLSLAQEAWGCFLAAPLMGSAMVNPSLGDYPHNIVLEVLMATGILGGIMLVTVVGVGAKSAWLLVRGGSAWRWAGLLYLQVIVLSMFSGSLFLDGGFWAWSVAVVSIASTLRSAGVAGTT